MDPPLEVVVEEEPRKAKLSEKSIFSNPDGLSLDADYLKGAKHSSGFESPEEPDNDVLSFSDIHSSAMSHLFNETATPFAKMLAILKSLRSSFPPSPSKVSKHPLDHDVNILSSPSDKLEWCISEIEEYSSRNLMNTASFETFQKQIKQALQQLAEGEEEDIVMWAEHVAMENPIERLQTPVRRALSQQDEILSTPSREVGSNTPPHDNQKFYYRLVADPSLGSSNELPEVLIATSSQVQEFQSRLVASHLHPNRELWASKISFSEQDLHAPGRAVSKDPDARPRFSGSQPLRNPQGPSESQRKHRTLPRVQSAPLIARRPTDPNNTAMSAQCVEHLKDIDCWGLDIFKLDALSGGRPMATITMRILTQRKLFDSLPIDPAVVHRYLMAIEDDYGRYPKIVYHNNQHSADVVHSTHVLLLAPNLADQLSDLELFAALIAAAVHDVQHPGLNNQYLIATSAPLAVLYNDQSVLENHHAASAFALLQKPGLNFLAHMDKASCAAFRSMVIAMVLCTDMAKHFKFLSDFKALIERRRPAGAPVPIPLSNSSNDDRVLLLCGVIHLADLGASTKPWEFCEEWSRRIMTEFFNQGDRERELGLELGPLNDRSKILIPKSQIGFMDFIAIPLWDAWDDFVGRNSVQHKYLKENKEHWVRKTAEMEGRDRKGSSERITPLSPSHPQTPVSPSHQTHLSPASALTPTRKHPQSHPHTHSHSTSES